MIGKKVLFYDKEGKKVIGIIHDKVNLPIASGINQYVPMDMYMVISEDNQIYYVNPINLIAQVEGL